MKRNFFFSYGSWKGVLVFLLKLCLTQIVSLLISEEVPNPNFKMSLFAI